MVFLLFAPLALIVLPAGYIYLCRRMAKNPDFKTLRIAYFFIFGTFGGFCIAMAFSPSALGLLCLLPVLLSSALSLFAVLGLMRCKATSIYHQGALVAGLVASLPVIWIAGLLTIGAIVHAGR